MKILIAPDKFKGSLTAEEVGKTIAKACLAQKPSSQINFQPLADGGEGSIEILANTLGLKYHSVEVSDPIGRPITSGYYYSTHAAFIEMASASGLTLLLEEERTPLTSTTFGTGLLLRDAINRGFQEIFLFIGGSATNDAGLGIAEAMGYMFLDKEGKKLSPFGGNLHKIAKINNENVNTQVFKTKITVLCDVKNPLYGKRGAAWVYGEQKGASISDIKILDKGLKHIDGLFKTQLGKNVGQLPSAGAAGGVGAGMVAFFDAQLQSGIQTIMNLTNFEQKALEANLIITGEGKLDVQTLEGKVVKAVAEKAHKLQKPLLIIVGQNTLSNRLLSKLNTRQVFAIMDFAKDSNDAMSNASKIIERIVDHYWMSVY